MCLFLLLHPVLLEQSIFFRYANLIFNFLSILYLKDALTKYQEITNNLEFARELQKSFMALGQEVSPKLYLFL